MGLLIDAVDSDPELLMLLQKSHLPEHRADLSSQLRQRFANIAGRKTDSSKDIYSDFFTFLRYGILVSGEWVVLILLLVGK